MPLDLPTLYLVAICITGLLGLFLLVLWLQDRAIRALMWWGIAYLTGCFAVVLWLIESFTTWPVPRESASALLFVVCGLIWNGARMFHGRRTLPVPLLAGAAVWLLASQFSPVAESMAARIVLSSLIIAVYAFLTSLELKRERRKPLIARLHLAATPAIHGAVFLLPILIITLAPATLIDFEKGWFALFALLTLIYVVGTAFIVVVLANAQSTLMLKTAALTDPLSGLFNRRGFFESAEKLAAAQAAAGQPVTVLMFDLDFFKKINDQFGHAAGDDVLRLFAATAAGSMRANDIIGRLGGEEFAAILPGGEEQGLIVAERVRLAFQEAGQIISAQAVGATVSIGLACDPHSRGTIESLLTRADAALYLAKSNGRNRIAMATPADPPEAALAAPEMMPQLSQGTPAQGTPALPAIGLVTA